MQSTNETATLAPEATKRTRPPDGTNRTAEITAFVALLLLALLLGGTWAQAGEDTLSARGASPTEQPASKGVPPPQSGDAPAIRSHPRGLPRRVDRPGARRHDPGPTPTPSGPPIETEPGKELRSRRGGARA